MNETMLDSDQMDTIMAVVTRVFRIPRRSLLRPGGGSRNASDARHAFVYLSCESGVSKKEVAAYLGRVSSTISQAYSKCEDLADIDISYREKLHQCDQMLHFGGEGIEPFKPRPYVSCNKKYRFSPRKLKDIRNRMDLTTKEFAKAGGVAYKTVWAWEAGNNEGPMLSCFLILCGNLGINPMHLMEEDND